MTKSEEQSEEKEPKPEPTRLDEARGIIEEYAASLREIIKKLRHKMN